MEPAAKRARAEESPAPSGSATAAIHADALLLESNGKAFSTDADVAPPLSLSTTFLSPGDGSEGGHVYRRISAPTLGRSEALLAAVESSERAPAHAVLYSSGLAACFAIMSRALPGKVAIGGGYHGTHLVLQQLHRLGGGSKFQKVPLPPPNELHATLQPGDLVWLESPLNPTCSVADVAAYAEAAKAIGGVWVVVDATFAPPPLQRLLEHGASAVVHATTKYLAGHSDALGGAVCVRDPELAKQLQADRVGLGSTPGALEVWLLMRSLRTLHLRVDRQSRTASELVAWLHEATVSCEHPLSGHVHAVHHPSLPTSPDHVIAKRQMPGGFGGCFALELKTEAAAKALPDALELFKNATSLGGVESLIEWRYKHDSAISPLLLRVSVGLEDVADLKADLTRGVKKVGGQ